VEERYCGQELILVQRVRCPRCGKTFRLLPEFVVPYKQHPAERVGAALGSWQERRSYHGVARAWAVAVGLVRRWVRWWQRVEAVMAAAGAVSWLYGPGWLSSGLRLFCYWSGAGHCWREGLRV
jgi:hypothetical protein